VLLRSCPMDAVSEVSSIIMYRWLDSVSTPSATLQMRIRRCRLAVVHVTSTTEDPLHATHVLVEPLLVSRSLSPAAQSDSILPRVFVRVSPHCEERSSETSGVSDTSFLFFPLVTVETSDVHDMSGVADSSSSDLVRVRDPPAVSDVASPTMAGARKTICP
jgi:hypothetical protein